MDMSHFGQDVHATDAASADQLITSSACSCIPMMKRYASTLSGANWQGSLPAQASPALSQQIHVLCVTAPAENTCELCHELPSDLSASCQLVDNGVQWWSPSCPSKHDCAGRAAQASLIVPGCLWSVEKLGSTRRTPREQLLCMWL